MKLLFDQNISYRLVNQIEGAFPSCGQVRELGFENSTDNEIWEYAKENEYAIVTFDADFYEISQYRGHPPKIIWIWTGNITTKNLAGIFIERKDEINNFLENEEYSELACLEITQKGA